MASQDPSDYESGSFSGTHRFLTDAPAPRLEPRTRGVGGLTVSTALHAAGLCAIGLMVARSSTSPAATFTPPVTTRLVWTASGPGASLGGGGEEEPKPARQAQRVGRLLVALPSAAPPAPAPDPSSPREAPETQPRLVVPEPQVAAGLTDMIGAVSELRPIDFNRGFGSGAGADGGRGDGIGGRDGNRSGSRPGPGSGDDEGLKPGNGVSWPRLVQEVKPNYTAAAMRAQVEGKVELEIVVLADGSVGRVNLVRSLDGRFGLDDEAISAVRRWRFEPARHSGKAVPVRVGVELSFNLR
jgi:periplasmic protein TonB